MPVVSILIKIHIILGAIALGSGMIALVASKGRKVHRLAGKIFFYSMLTSTLVAIFIALMPNHENNFLLAIGIFTAYFILSGYAALKYKIKAASIPEKSISWGMLITGLLMIALPFLFNGSINIILAVFGFLGIGFSIKDILLFKKPEELKEKWLNLHLSKMVAAYISAFTAFVVVNHVFPSVYLNWFLPGIIGGLYIAFWSRKIKKPK